MTLLLENFITERQIKKKKSEILVNWPEIALKKYRSVIYGACQLKRINNKTKNFKSHWKTV